MANVKVTSFPVLADPDDADILYTMDASDPSFPNDGDRQTTVGATRKVKLQDEGTPVANTPHTTINFTGAAVAVSDEGAGVAGVAIASQIIVQDEGTPATNTPHTTINFTGAGVTATDAGAGVVDVDVPIPAPPAILGTIQANPDTFNSGTKAPYSAKSAGSTASTFYSFSIPTDFSSVSKAVAVFIPNATGVAVDIDITLNFNAAGELFNANSNTDTSSTFSFTDDQLSEIDLDSLGLFTGVVAGDYVGIELDHNAIGTTLYHIGVYVEYNRT